MKKSMMLLAVLATAGLLAACGTQTPAEEPVNQVANPAAEFCVAQGGTSEVEADEAGNQYGFCVINGERYDERELYYAFMDAQADFVEETADVAEETSTETVAVETAEAPVVEVAAE